MYPSKGRCEIMIKWLGRTVYIIIILLLTLQIYFFAFQSKLQQFYEEHMASYVDDNDAYLVGMNTLADIDYYQKTPIYSFTSDNPDYQFEINVHAIGALVTNQDNKQVRADGLLVYINKVSIRTIETPIIRLTLTLDQNSIIVRDSNGDNTLTNKIQMEYNPKVEFPRSNIPILFLVKTEGSLVVPETGILSNIKVLKAEISDGVTDRDDQLIYDPKALFIASDEIVPEGAYVKDDQLIIRADDYSLRSLFAADVPSESEIETYNLITDREDLSQYNGIVWRTMIGYGLMVVLITYLLFFHKNVMIKMREKKDLAYRKAHPKDHNQQEVVDAEIFKENDGQ